MSSRQQSLQRAIKRGNAIVCIDSVTRRPYIVWKHGSGKREWKKQNMYFRSYEYEQNILGNEGE